MTVAQLVKIFLAFYKTLNFVKHTFLLSVFFKDAVYYQVCIASMVDERTIIKHWRDYVTK